MLSDLTNKDTGHPFKFVSYKWIYFQYIYYSVLNLVKLESNMLSGNPFFKNPIMKEAIWVFSKKRKVFHRYVHQFSSIALSCLILQLHGLQRARLPCPSPTPDLTQSHVHPVSDAIQPSHPLLAPSPPTFNLSRHQGLF